MSNYRLEVAFGSENLVSTRDGRNIRSALALTTVFLSGKNKVGALIFSRSDRRWRIGAFPHPPNHAISLWGAYAVDPLRFLPRGHGGPYYLRIDNQSVPSCREDISLREAAWNGAI